MKRLLITGTSGFIGQNLMKIIEKYYLKEYEIFLLNDKLNDNYKTILYDNTYHFNVSEIESIGYIDTVIILGGGVPKTNEQKNDIPFNFGSFDSIFFLLSNLRVAPKRIVYCSSVDVYGNSSYDKIFNPNEQEIISENTIVNPNDKYSLFKYLGELFIKDYCKIKNIEFVILRLGPVFGNGDLRLNFLIPTWIKNAREGKNLTLTGHPEMKRNLIYVEDVCHFILKSIYCKKNVIINVVSTNNPSLLEIAQSIIEASKQKIELDINKSGLYYGKNRIFDASKRIYYLGEERFSFKDGIKEIIKTN